MARAARPPDVLAQPLGERRAARARRVEPDEEHDAAVGRAVGELVRLADDERVGDARARGRELVVEARRDRGDARVALVGGRAPRAAAARAAAARAAAARAAAARARARAALTNSSSAL